MTAKSQDVVGVVPAAGWGRRVAPLPCSKEIYPVGWHVEGEQKGRPKVAVHYLLENMRRAGARRAYVVLREGKWDIPAYLGDGRHVGLALAYLMVHVPHVPHGVPFTIDAAYPFVREAHVLFGFPDVLFRPVDAFERLLARQQATGADLVLGLFPTDRPHKMDMVELDARDHVRSLAIKPATATSLQYTWLIAAWAPGTRRRSCLTPTTSSTATALRKRLKRWMRWC